MVKKISLKNMIINVVFLVNTASYCGFTNQYNDLQKLHDKFSDKDFIVLEFPQIHLIKRWIMKMT